MAPLPIGIFQMLFVAKGHLSGSLLAGWPYALDAGCVCFD
jgi:hypothetical protein